MAGSAVDVRTVEVAIETSAGKALGNLDALIEKLESLAGTIDGAVSKAGGLSTIGKGSSNRGISSSAKSIEKTAKASNDAAKQVDKFMQKMNATGFTGKSSVQKAAEDSSKAITDYKEQMRRFGVDTEQKGIKFLMGEGTETAKRAELLSKRAKGYRNAFDVLGKRPDNQVDRDMQTISDLEGSSRRASVALAELAKRKSEALSPTSGTGGDTAASVEQTAWSLGEYDTALAKVEQSSNLTSTAIDRFKNIVRGVREGAQFGATALGKFSRAVQLLANPLKLVSKAGQKFRELLGIGGGGGLFGGRRSFGQFLGMMLLRRAIMSVIRALVAGIKEGSDNLTQYSSEYNHSISSMSSALKYLKNAWAAAFAPIVNVVAPYITSFINMLASALNAIGRFLSALTGKGFAVQAKPVWQDYADSLGGAASGAGKAAKAAKEYQKTLMSFDQIHALNSPDNSSSGGGGGGGGGSSDGLSVKDMFTTTSIEGSMKDFANRLREAAKAGNWFGVGQIIGEKLNEVLSDKKIWEDLGKKIAGYFNIAIDTFYGFVKTFGFKQFGTDVGALIGNALANIHWKNLGGGLGRFATGLFEFLAGLMEEIDWKQLGNDIKTGIGAFFSELKWSSIWAAVLVALNSLLDFCIGLMPDFGEVGDYIVKAIGDFFDSVPESKMLAIAAKIALFLIKCVENSSRFLLGLPNKFIESIFGVDLLGGAYGAVEDQLDKGIQGIESGKIGSQLSLSSLFTGSHGSTDAISEFFTGTNSSIKKYMPQLEGNALQAGKVAWKAITKYFNEKSGKKTGTKTTTSIGNGVKGKSSWLASTVGKVTSGVGKLFDIGKDTKKNAQKSVEKFGDTIKGMQNPLGAAINLLMNGVQPKFNIGNKVAPYGSAAVTAFGNSAGTKKDWVAGVMGAIATGSVGKLNVNSTASAYGANATTNFGNGILGKQAIAKNNATTVANAAKNALDVKAAASTHGINIGAKFAEGISSKKSAVSTAATDVSNAVKASLGSGYDQGYKLGQSLVNGINSGIKSIKAAKLDYKINYTTINGNRVATSMDPKTNYVKLAASGGLFSAGEMFMARENGLPELVGRIGNRSAVANNQQIISGIESGVARGVMAAMSATSNGGSSVPYEIHVTVKTQNDEVLARAVDRGNAKRQYRLGTAMG